MWRIPVRSLFASVLAAAILLGAPTARAATILVVLDSGADMGIATALMADGHSVTVSPTRFASGSNAALRADLSGYDVVYWSQDGGGAGDAVTDAMLFANLTTYVTNGGRILVTGYDSVASPSDPMLIAFLGASASADVVGAPGPVMMIDNSLTTGVVDIRGVTPTGGVGDTDHMTGLMAGTVAVCNSASGTGAQWTLRTLGAGQIAYISNGSSSASWTNTSAGGAGAFNAAIRNFAGAASAPCTGEGTACTSSSGATGTCRMARCCTGCWDGTRCVAGTAPTTCGVGGATCASCVDGEACSSDVCTAGVCSNPDAPMGTPCDDGMYCTLTDVCNATRTCTGAGVRCDDGQSCTVDSCDEAADMCVYTPAEGGCTIAGACHAAGTPHPIYACMVCDPATSTTDWTTLPVGASCGANRCTAGRLTAAACDAMGACVMQPPVRCPTGLCADTTSCGPLSGLGEPCATGTTCESGACADGVCCDVACDGTCMACDLSGREGTCVPIARDTDPDMECATGETCDGAGACAVPMPDAGPPPIDAGAEDAGPSDAATIDLPDIGPRTGGRGGTCTCSVPGAPDRGSALALAALAIALAIVRRRRGR